jgi:glycerol-3-phosphate acyltransferase PlsY
MLFLAVMGIAVVGGGFPTKRVVNRLWRVDLEAVGTGNAGAGNATRSIGLRAGVLVAVVDGLKGLVPVLLGRALGLSEWSLVVVGLVAVTGNNWPIYGRRRGGRGLATSVGVVLGAAPVLLWWPAVWSAVGWRIGGAAAGFFGWGLLPVFAIVIAQDPPALALAIGLSVAMVIRRAQGNAGFERGSVPSRIVFDEDGHVLFPTGFRSGVSLWVLVVAGVYVFAGWWVFQGGVITGVGTGGLLLLLLAVCFEFGAKWAFGELFREGVIHDGAPAVSRMAAFRAALIGSGVARLIPAGGAVTPVAMAWAVRDEARGTSGAAVRATMLNYAGLLIGSGGAIVWVLLRVDRERHVVSLSVLAGAMLVAGFALVAGAGRLRRLSWLVPRRWRDKVRATLVDLPLGPRSVLLIVARVSFEAIALGLSLRAFAIHLAPSQVIAAFGISQLVGGIPGTPGGVGFTEAGLAGVLAFYGVGPALGPILAFRVISYWLPAAAGASVGGFSFLQLRASTSHSPVR